MDRDKIIKMVVILAAVVVLATGLSKYSRRDSMSLAEYARLHDIPETQASNESMPASPSPDEDGNSAKQPETSASPAPETGSLHASENPNANASVASASPDPNAAGSYPSVSPDPEAGTSSPNPASTFLTGASLNGSSELEQRVLLEDGFYYEPLSVHLCRYITGISYPAFDEEEEAAKPEISLNELRYVHILHYNFEGTPTEGELICNESIAQDLVEIFYELYRNEYQLEKVLLIDEYNGDDTASMEDNNTSCFNYRPVTGSTSLSKHALGLAIDINPLYNPYITYTENGEENVLPASASSYADRSMKFPYKIDENDLCYKLFTQHGFTWGGNWNSMKDYQHFQKTK